MTKLPYLLQSPLILVLAALLPLPAGATDIQELSKQAALAHKQAKHQDCIRLCDQILAAERNNEPVYLLRAVELFSTGKAEPAIRDLNFILDRDQKNKQALLIRGQIRFLELDDFPNALADFTLLLSQEPNSDDALIWRADTLRKLNRYNEALADFNTALKLYPAQPDGYLSRGFLFLKQNKLDLSIADFKKAIDLRKNGPSAEFDFAWMSVALKRQGKAQEAKKFMDLRDVPQVTPPARNGSTNY